MNTRPDKIEHCCGVCGKNFIEYIEAQHNVTQKELALAYRVLKNREQRCTHDNGQLLNNASQ